MCCRPHAGLLGVQGKILQRENRMYMFIVQISPWVQRTIYTRATGAFWREFRAFSAAIANQYHWAFIVPLCTHYCRVNRGSMEREVYTLPHIASTGNQTPHLLILSPAPNPQLKFYFNKFFLQQDQAKSLKYYNTKLFFNRQTGFTIVPPRAKNLSAPLPRQS